MMTLNRLKNGLVVFAVVAAMVALVRQHQALIKLRAENEALAQRLVQMQAKGAPFFERVTPVVVAKSSADEKLLELLKLRGEVGMLRQQLQTTQAGQPAEAKNDPLQSAGYLAKAQLTNAGLETPEAALRTFTHGMLSGNYDQLLSALAAKYRRELETLGPQIAKEDLTESEEATNFIGEQILAKNVINDESIDLEVLIFQTGMAPKISFEYFVKEGNEWKFAGGHSDLTGWSHTGQVQSFIPASGR